MPKLTKIDVKDLPTPLVTKVREIMESKTNPRSMKMKPLDSGDHYTFKISIHEGENEKSLNVVNSQYELQKELKYLVD